MEKFDRVMLTLKRTDIDFFFLFSFAFYWVSLRWHDSDALRHTSCLIHNTVGSHYAILQEFPPRASGIVVLYPSA